MDRAEMMRLVEDQMPAKRWKHTRGVMDTAVRLAERYGADPVKADIASILHDVAKYWPTERMRELIEREDPQCGVLLYDKELWHAEAGAIHARQAFGITDAEIIGAVRWHTSGRAGMTLLEKIVWLADLIEPGRDFPGVDKIRELAQHNLHKALLAGFDTTIDHLIRKQKKIYPETVHARNDLLTILSKEAV